MRVFLVFLLSLLNLSTVAQAAPDLDLILSGGRVMDPQTRVNAVREVGVAAGTIVAISEVSLTSRLKPTGQTLDVRGLVVAPGFIDLHAHGQTNRANEYQVRDGVTTALELEGGYLHVAEWLASRKGQALINFGCAVSHSAARAHAMPEYAAALQGVTREGAEPTGADYKAIADEHLEMLFQRLQRGLQAGALGIGMPHQYYPGADRREIFRVFQFAASQQMPIFTHVRSMRVDAMQEVIANSAATGAPLHIVHVNSSSLEQLPVVLDLIAGARERGVNVTTEAYPYTAASTGIESAIFDDGWQRLLGISYGDLQWQDTGERLTEETFNKYRTQKGIVIMHMMKPEWIDLAMRTPFVMVASDGMPYAAGAHPRSAGTFSRVLGEYVRERKVLDLMTALEKMTLMPAQRLEPFTKGMDKKGRIQVGADADITVFDPGKIHDTATYESGLDYSVGVAHVLIGGVPIVRDGLIVPGVYPGKAVVGKYLQ
jgi:N-acyl-D-aspartate/D-glutamate deacylase